MTEPRPLAVFGGINIDIIATTDATAVTAASNPGTVERRIGGVAFNVASVLARLGNRVRLIGRVGDDDEGMKVLGAARTLGIVAEGITRSPRYPTGSYVGTFSDTGDLVVGVADMRATGELRAGAKMHIDDPPERTEILVLDANLPDETIDRLTGHVVDADHSIAADHAIAALTVSPAKAVRLSPYLPRLTWLFANRMEAGVLLAMANAEPRDDITDLARALADLGPRGVVVTDGPNPLAIVTGETALTIAPPPVPVTRVNGAGDTLAAGTLHRLAAGIDLGDAVDAGLAAAALVLEHGGIAEAAFDAERLDHLADLVRAWEEA